MEPIIENRELLRVEGLQTHFFTRRGVIKAVDGVSFSIREGETLGIVGESGSGKSITSLSILRLVPQPAGKIVAGRIMFEGEDLLTKSEKEMKRIRGGKISMILQDPMTSLDPLFTIGEQIAEAIRTHQNLDKGEVKEKILHSSFLIVKLWIRRFVTQFATIALTVPEFKGNK